MWKNLNILQNPHKRLNNSFGLCYVESSLIFNSFNCKWGNKLKTNISVQREKRAFYEKKYCGGLLAKLSMRHINIFVFILPVLFFTKHQLNLFNFHSQPIVYTWKTWFSSLSEITPSTSVSILEFSFCRDLVRNTIFLLLRNISIVIIPI